MFISCYQAFETAEPGKGALDNPSVGVSDFDAEVLIFFLTIFSVWGKQSYPTLLESFPEWITIIGLVCNYPLWAGPGTTNGCSRNLDVLQGFFSEIYFRRRGRVDMASQRYTLAIDYHHPLRSLYPAWSFRMLYPFFLNSVWPNESMIIHGPQGKQPLILVWTSKTL